MGRPLNKNEGMAAAIMMDALACGRTVAATVEATEMYGPCVSDATKRILGLLPPLQITIPDPPRSLINN